MAAGSRPRPRSFSKVSSQPADGKIRLEASPFHRRSVTSQGSDLFSNSRGTSLSGKLYLCHSQQRGSNFLGQTTAGGSNTALEIGDVCALEIDPGCDQRVLEKVDSDMNATIALFTATILAGSRGLGKFLT
jgi:hypothetical protein